MEIAQSVVQNGLIYSVRQENRPLKKRPLATVKVSPRMTKKAKVTKSSLLESMSAEQFSGLACGSLESLSKATNDRHKKAKPVDKIKMPGTKPDSRGPLQRQPNDLSIAKRADTSCQDTDKLKCLREMLRQNANASSINDMEKAIEIALFLLHVGPIVPASTERQFLSTCQRCGCKAIKIMLSNKAAVNNASRQQKAQESKLLDKAQLILQMVVIRNFEKSAITRLNKKTCLHIRELQTVVKDDCSRLKLLTFISRSFITLGRVQGP